MFNIEKLLTALRHMRLDTILPVASVVVLIALAIKSALVAHWGLLLAVCIFGTLLSVSIWAKFKQQESGLPEPAMQASLVVLIFCVVFYLGVSGALWVFPALVWLRFTTAGAASNAMIGVLVIGLPVILGAQGDWSNASRVAVTMALSIGYLWLVEGELLSLRERLGVEEGHDSLTDAFTRHQFTLDQAQLKQGGAMGVLLVQINDFLDLRDKLGPDEADAVVQAAVDQMNLLLSGKERIYRVGAADLLVGLPGWRSYECFELGQRMGARLSSSACDNVTLRFGVSEIASGADPELAMRDAYDSLTIWNAQSTS